MAAYPQASHEIHKSFPKVAKEGVLRDGPTKHIPAVEECAIEGDAATKDIRPDLPAAGVRYQHGQRLSHSMSEDQHLLSAPGSKLRAAVVAARLYAPKGPPFHIDTDADGDVAGEPIGVSIYLIFDLLSNTAAAYDLFRLPRFNAALKKLLDPRESFLSDPKRLQHRSDHWP